MSDRKKLHPGFKKNAKVIAIVAGLGLAATAITIMAIKDRKAPVSVVDVPPLDTRGSTKSTETPNYSRALNRVNDQQFQKAEQSDSTFIPTLSDAAKSTPLEDDLAKRAQENPVQVQRDYARPGQEASHGQPPQVAQGVSDQVTALRALWTAGGSSQEIVRVATTSPSTPNTSPAATTTGGDMSRATTSTASRDEAPYIRGLEQVPGVYANSIDTDAPSDVLVTIETGKYAGSTLYGTARLSNEVIITEFSKMRTPLGPTVSISASALDEKELRTAQPADIDHRYVQRVGVPALLGALGAAGSVYQNAGSIVQQTPLGGVTQTTNPNPSGRQLAGAATASGLQAVQQVIQQENASIPPRRGFIPKGTPVMVLFKADVYLK